MSDKHDHEHSSNPTLWIIAAAAVVLYICSEGVISNIPQIVLTDAGLFFDITDAILVGLILTHFSKKKRVCSACKVKV